MRVDGDDLLDQTAACRGHQPQLVPVMHEGSGEDAGLLQQIAVEPQRRDHVARIVGDLGEGLTVTAQRGEGLDDRLDPLAVGAYGLPSRLPFAILSVEAGLCGRG